MSRFFGQSKSNVVSKPTLNDTASIIDSRVEVLNRQIAAVDQGLLKKKNWDLIKIFVFRITSL